MKKKLVKPDYESWLRQKVRITDLFLDPVNIRLQIEIESSQGALINDLFLNENAMQILESIASNGFFPDEVPVVIKEGKKYTVIDGNRRVAALKVLARPEIVPAKELRVKELLKESGPVIKNITVIVAPNRELIRHFLASKHTQTTRRPWRPLRQAYFYKAELESGTSVQELRNEYPGVNIDKFLKMISIHKIAKSISYDNSQVASKVHTERKFPISTLGRLYEDKYVRKFLGFEFNKDCDVSVKIQKSEFEKGFRKIIQDVVDNTVNSRALNSEDNRREYVDSFTEEYTPKQSRGRRAITSNDFTEQSLPPANRRTKLVPKDIVFTLRAPGVKRMLIELQDINYHKFPNATHDLLRSFLECALKAYFSEMGVNVIPKRGSYVFLKDALEKFQEEMESKNNKPLGQVAKRIMSDNKMSAYSAQFLNAMKHNPSVFAVDKDVEEAWDSMECLFRYILDPK